MQTDNHNIKNEVVELVCGAFREVINMSDSNSKKPKKIDENTLLEILDSLNLISLVVSVEQKVREKFNIPISIVNERSMSQKNSLFKTIGDFADYIILLLGESSDG